ncbi:MAG: hypothetical protein ACI9X0_001139 [Kiritimatiellia bacterium]|jgi:hypothetical protein
MAEREKERIFTTRFLLRPRSARGYEGQDARDTEVRRRKEEKEPKMFRTEKDEGKD